MSPYVQQGLQSQLKLDAAPAMTSQKWPWQSQFPSLSSVPCGALSRSVSATIAGAQTDVTPLVPHLPPVPIVTSAPKFPHLWYQKPSIFGTLNAPTKPLIPRFKLPVDGGRGAGERALTTPAPRVVNAKLVLPADEGSDRRHVMQGSFTPTWPHR